MICLQNLLVMTRHHLMTATTMQNFPPVPVSIEDYYQSKRLKTSQSQSLGTPLPENPNTFLPKIPNTSRML